MDLKITGFVTRSGHVVGDPTGGLFTVTFYYGYKHYYTTMQKANVGRVWASALKNVPRNLNSRSPNGWADLARYIGMEQSKLRYDGKKRSRRSMSSGVSNKVFGMAMRGTLPKDSDKLHLLLELAGEPWLTEYGKCTT